MVWSTNQTRTHKANIMKHYNSIIKDNNPSFSIWQRWEKLITNNTSHQTRKHIFIEKEFMTPGQCLSPVNTLSRLLAINSPVCSPLMLYFLSYKSYWHKISLHFVPRLSSTSALLTRVNTAKGAKESSKVNTHPSLFCAAAAVKRNTRQRKWLHRSEIHLPNKYGAPQIFRAKTCWSRSCSSSTVLLQMKVSHRTRCPCFRGITSCGGIWQIVPPLSYAFSALLAIAFLLLNHKVPLGIKEGIITEHLTGQDDLFSPPIPATIGTLEIWIQNKEESIYQTE